MYMEDSMSKNRKDEVSGLVNDIMLVVIGVIVGFGIYHLFIG